MNAQQAAFVADLRSFTPGKSGVSREPRLRCRHARSLATPASPLTRLPQGMEALEHNFCDFLALLFPAIHDKINWRRTPAFLDKELQQVVRDADGGRRYADI